MNEKYKKLFDAALESVPGIKRTGLIALELDDRHCKLLMPMAGNVNHIGIMYAGSLFTIGEIAGGIIHMVSLDYERLVPIVKEVSIRFRRPAMTDVTMEVSMTKEEADRIQSEAFRQGKADFNLNLELKDSTGEVVALVTGTWQARPRPTGM